MPASGSDMSEITIAEITTKTRDDLLDRAKDLVNGPRNKVYGDPTTNHERIADLWTVILKRRVTTHEVYLMMVALKLSRLIETPGHEDSWVDMIGYAALGGENESTNGDVCPENRVDPAYRTARLDDGKTDSD